MFRGIVKWLVTSFPVLVVVLFTIAPPALGQGWVYNQMNGQNCYSCHNLGTFIPGSSYIARGMGLDQYQNCLACHPSRFYEDAATPPITVTDRGYDLLWPYSVNMRVFLFEAADSPEPGTLTFTAALFSSGNEQPDGNPNCPRFSATGPTPGYRLVGEFRNLNVPGVSGSFSREDLETFRREALAWNYRDLPAGRYEIRLTPFYQLTAGIPFVMEFDVAGHPTNPPVLAPIGDQTVAEGQTLTFTLSASDPDPGQTLTFSAAHLPPGAVFDPATGTFTWTTGYDQAGTYPGIEFTVTDNGTPISLDLEMITITVGDVNRAPIFSPLGPQAVPAYDLLTFVVSASDPDGNPFVLYPGQLPAGASFDQATGLFSWRPDGTQAGVYPISFFAADEGLPPLTSRIDVVITVGQASSPLSLIQILINRILTDNLAPEVVNSYMANLKKVEIFIQEGKLGPAINQMRAFVNKADKDIEKGLLAPAEGAYLLMLANDIIALLGG